MKTGALEDYFRLMTANGAVQVYQAAWQHGVFAALAGGPLSTARLATSTQLDEGALALLLDALRALGAVESTDVGYRLGAVMQALGGSYRSLGAEYWQYLGEYLKTGQPLRRMNSVTEGEAAYRDQAAALAWMMMPSAALAAAKLSARLPADAAILDVGAGSGVWSLALLSTLPASTATLIDWPGVLVVARQFAEQAGVAERVRSEGGDYHDLEPAVGAYDLVILGNVCHLENAEGNLALFRRAATWLRPGGRLAIIDVCAPQEPLAAALYAIGLALRTTSAAVHSGKSLGDWLGQAGFENFEYYPLSVAPGTMALWTVQRRPHSIPTE